MPIDFLPEDALHDIFLILCSTTSLNRQNSARYLSQVEVMASVCRQWRALVLDSALLWTDLVIAPTSTWERMTRWLERSREAPLSITIILPPTETGWKNFGLEAQTDLLKPHFERIQNLFFIPASIAEAYLPLQVCTQVLEPLSVSPKIRRLALLGIVKNAHLNRPTRAFPGLFELTVPYGGLRNWHLNDLRRLKMITQSESGDATGRAWEELHRILLASRDLEELELQRPFDHNAMLPPFRDVRPLVFENLRVLRITHCKGPILNAFCYHAKFSNLHTLSIGFHHSQDERPQMKALRTALVSVQRLEIDFLYERHEDKRSRHFNQSLQTIFALSPPKVDTLRVRTTDAVKRSRAPSPHIMNDDTISMINCMPALKHIILDDVRPATGSPLLEVIGSRSEDGCTPLESFRCMEHALPPVLKSRLFSMGVVVTTSPAERRPSVIIQKDLQRGWRTTYVPTTGGRGPCVLFDPSPHRPSAAELE